MILRGPQRALRLEQQFAGLEKLELWLLAETQCMERKRVDRMNKNDPVL